MKSRKNLPYKLNREPNDAQNTQHKLGAAFSYVERNQYATGCLHDLSQQDSL